MAEEEAAEVEAGSEGGSGYALMTDAWPTCVKVSLPDNTGDPQTAKFFLSLYGILLICNSFSKCAFGKLPLHICFIEA